MKRVAAFIATVVVGVSLSSAPAFASHKSNSPHANPPDCAIEVDPLGLCLG